MLKDHSTELRDEQLSKRPATALPWRTLKEPQDKERRCRVLAAEGGVAILCVNRQLGDPGPSKAELQNAEYITHAANSYPRLVEVLSDVMRDQLKTVNLHQMAPGPRQRIERARALLRSLGEE